jgi:hypothetical protein
MMSEEELALPALAFTACKTTLPPKAPVSEPTRIGEPICSTGKPARVVISKR